MLSSLSNSFSTLVSLHCEIETTVTESSKRVPVPEVLADARPSALLALAPSPSVLADARPSALLARAPLPIGKVTETSTFRLSPSHQSCWMRVHRWPKTCWTLSCVQASSVPLLSVCVFAAMNGSFLSLSLHLGALYRVSSWCYWR